MRLQAKQSHIRKRIFVCIGIGLLALVLGVVIWIMSRHVNVPAAQPMVHQPSQHAEAESHTVTMSAMGDMIAHDTITSNAKTASGYDYTKYFTHIRPLYSSSDAVFCNQESLSSGEEFGISGYPAFNAPVSYAADLQQAGCNVINLGNNHMGDKGPTATSATVSVWEKLKPLAYAGANRSVEEQNQVRYFEKNGIKFAFVAFMDFSNNTTIPSYSVNTYHDTALFEKLVREARAHADVVLVSMHWGTEDSHTVNQDQRDQVAKLASYGADIVIGTGPHVLQPVEYVARPDGRKMLVWYSIGNMLSSQLKLEELLGGVASWRVTKSTQGVVVDQPQFSPTYMSYEWTPSEQAAQDTDARKNPMIYPLSDAGDQLEQMRVNISVTQIRDLAKQWLGSTVTLK